VLLAGIHHVTCICSDATRTVAFYRDELGFNLVKKTVNFDDPGSYHLYFGDEQASPGTLMTFFEWPQASRGRLGRGTLESVTLTVPGTVETHVEDPDGLRLELVPGERHGIAHVTALGNPDLYAGLMAPDAPMRFAEPPSEIALIGAGITHHIAWRAADDAEQAAWIEHLQGLGLAPTPVQERKYFRSIYFRMPDGILIEIATDGPGFGVDEDELGSTLALPEWLERDRETLERSLTPIP